ncbi:MAG: hypothetical protein IT372_13690 [Polyangiaceae bacterium]|nr:hypothetical protein [Polyangiaceae bacterium]
MERWQGKATTEDDLAAEWGAPPYTLELHARYRLGPDSYLSLDPDSLRNLAFLRKRLSDRWLIAQVQARPFEIGHAIVMTEATPTGFRYLDPAEPPDGQPFHLPEDQFVRIWTGQVIIPRDRAA